MKNAVWDPKLLQKLGKVVFTKYKTSMHFVWALNICENPLKGRFLVVTQRKLRF